MLVGAGGRDPLVQLVGFATTDRPPGTVVDEVEAAGIGVHQFHGLPGAIRSNQRRTALGERFVQALGCPIQIAVEAA